MKLKTACYLERTEHVPGKAAFPAIDAHNHTWGDWNRLGQMRAVMNDMGVALYADLTANISLAWQNGGYEFGPGNIDGFFEKCSKEFPDRFYGFTTATFAAPRSQPLFRDAKLFVAQTIEILQEHVKKGAKGLKILKELGLHYRDSEGNLVFIDDERLAPIWDEAARLGIPVLMHQSDPVGFFEPVTPENEHYDSLIKYPSWSFADTTKFPRKAELMARRDRLLARHQNTTFILPHVANYPENLAYVGELLDKHPNVFIDFSARMDELGRQPYTAREFFTRHQDRILFGTDMPVSQEMYRCYFRFLETFDEFFFPPDYDGTFERHRWPICGIGLERPVLEKIYNRNALRIIPGLQMAFEKAIGHMEKEQSNDQTP